MPEDFNRQDLSDRVQADQAFHLHACLQRQQYQECCEIDCHEMEASVRHLDPAINVAVSTEVLEACEQDGSEVKSVALERLIAEGITLLERRNAFEFMRDYAADLFEAETGSTWRPRSGSKVSHANRQRR